MERRHAEEFIDALRALEEENDADRLLSLFASDAELQNPTDREPHRGEDGARHFWDSYRRTFQEIHSDFHHVMDAEDAAILEWTSRGRTSDGSPFTYDGVSIVEYADDGKIHRFRAYFDPNHLGLQVRRDQ